MAKKTKDEITEVTIRYDLFELPTAQHKAGLAGLSWLDSIAQESFGERPGSHPSGYGAGDCRGL